MNRFRRVDVAIIGAGIAGLWLANLLAKRGFSVALCDGAPVGGAQTAASQGIVHSGAKYVFGAAPAATALAQMPRRWRECLAGNADVDLRGVRVIAEQMQVLMRDDSAARLLPNFAKFADFADFVVDVPSLIHRLAEPVRHRLCNVRVDAEALVPGAAGLNGIEAHGCRLRASVYVFAAGLGNAALAQRIGASGVAMRRRPLRQTWIRLRGEAPNVFAHCFAPASRPPPELTVTSHGRTLSIGGKVADDGAARSEAEHIRVVRALLAAHLPAVDLTGAEFHTLRIDRAEPAEVGAEAPQQDAFVARHGNCLICWPVKLSLAPRLGDQVLTELADLRLAANAWPGDANAVLRYATPPWAAAAAGRCRSAS